MYDKCREVLHFYEKTCYETNLVLRERYDNSIKAALSDTLLRRSALRDPTFRHKSNLFRPSINNFVLKW